MNESDTSESPVSDLRKDPTRGQWVLVRPPGAGHADGGECPFCPGNERLTPPETACYRKDGAPANSGDWSVRAIPERDPYFRIELPLTREGVGLYDKITPRGATELILESPRHDDTPATMPEAQWERVLWMYGERIRDLKRDLAIRDILITRRHRVTGARMRHPYSRLTAIPIIFDEGRRKLDEARDYYRYKHRCIYCDIVRQELADRERVVHETERFVTVVPYAARAPFETWILPRQHAAAYEDALSGDLVADLARVLGGCFRTFAKALGDPSLEMTLYNAPNRASKVMAGEWATLADDYHWHIGILPTPERLKRIGGIYVNTTPPEEAAGLLREAWVSPAK
jgi:UDPglucose--hexose-1-phosphate uridylyltransferase